MRVTLFGTRGSIAAPGAAGAVARLLDQVVIDITALNSSGSPEEPPADTPP